MRLLSVAALAFLAASCDKSNNPPDDGGGNPVIDLAHGPPDLSQGGPDLSGGPKEPTCTPPGTVSCDGTDFFISSPTVSGCFATGTNIPNSYTPPYDNPAGPCSSVGDKVISCTHSPSCSFCIKIGAAVPPGCTAS